MAIDLDAIKLDLAAATPGPWAFDTCKNDADDLTSPDVVTRFFKPFTLIARCYPVDTPSPQEHRNARFIANAWKYTSDLVAEVEKHRAVMRRLATEMPELAVIAIARIVFEEMGEA